MNETKCKFCNSELEWVGSIIDGHLDCPKCASEATNTLDEEVVNGRTAYAADDGVPHDSCNWSLCVETNRDFYREY